MTLKTVPSTQNNLNHPVAGEPAFILESPPDVKGKGNVLVLADLHYGIEYSLAKAGAHLPSQTEQITEHILELCSELNITELILLGDIKHTIPTTSNQEWQELPGVFKRLAKAVDTIEIIPGNHDGNLRKLIPNNLTQIHFHPIAGTVLHDIGLFHGHAWPAPEVLQTAQVLMAHNHPNVLFIDKLGGRASYSCWLRGFLKKERAITRYPEINEFNPEMIIMPAFNDIGSGTPMNTAKPEFLGPVLKNGYIDTDNAIIYLLDGTDLGQLKKLTGLNNSSNSNDFEMRD